VWGGLDFRFAAHSVTPASVELGELALSCERDSTALVPCYSDLIDAVRGRATEFHGALTEMYVKLVSEGLRYSDRRGGATRRSGDSWSDSKRQRDCGNATVHFELDGVISVVH